MSTKLKVRSGLRVRGAAPTREARHRQRRDRKAAQHDGRWARTCSFNPIRPETSQRCSRDRRYAACCSLWMPPVELGLSGAIHGSDRRAVGVIQANDMICVH